MRDNGSSIIRESIMKPRVLDLYSGIGGFSLGLERAGMQTVAFCEIEEYPRKVLAKHWPDVPIYEDVRELTGDRLRQDGIAVDVICGGFPCQDISAAGYQAGIGKDTRSGLWSECARLLRELRPRYAIFENVTALLSGDSGRWFEQVLWDISQVGYDAEWHCIPASELGAHHHRDRVWIIAYPSSVFSHGGNTNASTSESQQGQSGNSGCEGDISNADSEGLQGRKSAILPQWKATKGHAWAGNEWEPEPAVGRVANGVPRRTHRLKALGNAVVPQIPEIIGRAIMDQRSA